MRGSCGGNAAPQPALRAAGRQEPLRAAAAAAPAAGAAPSCPAPPGRAAVSALPSSARAGGRAGAGPQWGLCVPRSGRVRRGRGGSERSWGRQGRAGGSRPRRRDSPVLAAAAAPPLPERKGQHIKKYASGGVGAEKRVIKLCEGSVCMCHLNGGSVIITGWFSQFKRGELFPKAAVLTLPDTTFRKSGLARWGSFYLYFLPFGDQLARCPSLWHCRRATRFPPLIYNVFCECVCKAAA